MRAASCDAVSIGAVKTAVDIEFEQAIFVICAVVPFKKCFELRREAEFFQLPQIGFFPREKDVFDDLLRECTAAAHLVPMADIRPNRAEEGFEAVAAVAIKILVFYRQHSLHKVRMHGVKVNSVNALIHRIEQFARGRVNVNARFRQ